MKIRYERLWSFGNYENETIGLEVECKKEDLEKTFESLKKTVFELHNKSMRDDRFDFQVELTESQVKALEKRRNKLKKLQKEIEDLAKWIDEQEKKGSLSKIKDVFADIKWYT